MSRSAAISSASAGLAKARSNIAPSAMVSRDGPISTTLSNRSAVKRLALTSRLLGVVEDHTDGMAMAGAEPADTVPQVNAVKPARPLHRAMMHSKGDRIALAEWHHLGARLHARALFGQHKFAAGEIAPRF